MLYFEGGILRQKIPIWHIQVPIRQLLNYNAIAENQESFRHSRPLEIGMTSVDSFRLSKQLSIVAHRSRHVCSWLLSEMVSHLSPLKGAAKTFACLSVKCNGKSPAYRRHWISQRVQKVAPIPIFNFFFHQVSGDSCHVSCFICYVSGVTWRISPVTYH